MLDSIKIVIKKYFFGKIEEVGVVKGIGFVPVDNYYIDDHTYLFGFRIKTNRYWNRSDYVNKKTTSKNNRVIVNGYNKPKMN
jgi:hypothetical protein